MRTGKILKALVFFVILAMSIGSAMSVDTTIKFTYRDPIDNELVFSNETNASVSVSLPDTDLDLVLGSVDDRFELIIPGLNISAYPEINISVYNSSKNTLPSTLLSYYQVRDAFAIDIDNSLNKTLTVKFKRAGNFPTISNPQILKAPFNFVNLTTNLSAVTLLPTQSNSEFVWVQVSELSNFILTNYVPYSPPSGGGGGGSGGGTGGTGGGSVYGGTPTSTWKANETFPYASPTSPINMYISIPEIAITNIKIEVLKVLSDVSLTVERMTSKPLSIPQPDGSIYQYDKITYSNIENNDILSVEITFRIRQSWFPENDVDPDSVVLVEYDGGWKELSATRTSSVDGYHYYRVKTDSLANIYSFVGYKVGRVLEPITGRPVVEPTIPPPAQPPAGPPPQPFNIWWIILPLTAIVILLLSGFGVYRLVQTQHEEKERAIAESFEARPELKPMPRPKVDISKIQPMIAPENVTELQKKKLQKYVFHALSQGYTEDQTKLKLLVKGWPKETVNEVIKQSIKPEEASGLTEVMGAVKKLLSKGMSREEITQLLKAKGWEDSQVEEIFRNI